MSTKAKILQRLYKAGKVSYEGLEQAVRDGVITEDEFREITQANVR